MREDTPVIQAEFGGNTVRLEIPFDSKNKWQASVHRTKENILVCCKGAPDRVLNMCRAVNDNGALLPVSEQVKAEVMSANEKFANKGQRVLALSYYEVPLSEEKSFFEEVELNGVKKWKAKIELQNKLVLAGLFALEDPARPEVPPAVKECHGAGVRVIMVTGDFSLTAQAIAKDIGILSEDPDKQHLNKVVSGDEIADKLAEFKADPSVDPKDVEKKVIAWVEKIVET